MSFFVDFMPKIGQKSPKMALLPPGTHNIGPVWFVEVPGTSWGVYTCFLAHRSPLDNFSLLFVVIFVVERRERSEHRECSERRERRARSECRERSERRERSEPRERSERRARSERRERSEHRERGEPSKKRASERREASRASRFVLQHPQGQRFGERA